MLAKAINFGRSQGFPTCLGVIYLPYNVPVDIPDRKAAKELSNWPLVDVTVVEGSLEEQRIDYSKYRVQELRSIAKQVGIIGAFFMKKVDLIKKLEDL